MKLIYAIDPGPTDSALVIYEPKTQSIVRAVKAPNIAIRERILCKGNSPKNLLAIEMIASYGMAVGESVFETCLWTGRFIDAWDGNFRKIKRLEVKLHLCKNSRANDANIRQRLIDLFGAPGTKKLPGATYGFAGDMWAALGVAVTAAETSNGDFPPWLPEEHGIELHPATAAETQEN